MDTFAIRLRPNDDLKMSLHALAQDRNLAAAYVVTCVGSLRRAVLRYADQHQAATLDGKFEITSLVGTFSTQGGHYHISISDEFGRTFGGHLMDGCLINTTAEIVIAVLPNVDFLRELDPATGYKELTIRKAK
jgi:uncharacterized protein